MLSVYFKLFINLIVNGFRKLRYGKRFECSWLERFSWSSSIRLYKCGSCHLGRNVELGPRTEVFVLGNGKLKIGRSTYMNSCCMISCHGNVSIGENCLFGPSVKIFDNNHRFSREKGVSTELSIGEITIGDNCWIASNVVLLKGAVIGDNCVIGAGCVINSKIPPGSVVKQNQCQIVEEIR